jgi:hypothetical protein
MPCDCSEDRPRPVPSGGCNYLVYSGGPPSSYYRLVEHAIPANVKLTHGRPTVHADGSLEFRGTPLTLSGYRQEGLRLHPIWPPCLLRMLRVQIIDGILAIDGICGGPEAAHFTFEVGPDQCQKCPARRAQP